MNVEFFLYLLVNIHQFIHGMASVNCWNWDWLALSWRFVYLFTSPYVWLWFSTTKKTLGQWEGASFQRWTHKVNILELWTVGKTLKVCFVKVFSCFANIWQFFLYGTLHATGTDSMCLKIQLKSTIPYMTKSYTIQWTQYNTIK